MGHSPHLWAACASVLYVFLYFVYLTYYTEISYFVDLYLSAHSFGCSPGDVWFLGCECTSPGRVWPHIHQHPQILDRAALDPAQILLEIKDTGDFVMLVSHTLEGYVLTCFFLSESRELLMSVTA